MRSVVIGLCYSARGLARRQWRYWPPLPHHAIRRPLSGKQHTIKSRGSIHHTVRIHTQKQAKGGDFHCGEDNQAKGQQDVSSF